VAGILFRRLKTVKTTTAFDVLERHKIEIKKETHLNETSKFYRYIPADLCRYSFAASPPPPLALKPPRQTTQVRSSSHCKPKTRHRLHYYIRRTRSTAWPLVEKALKNEAVPKLQFLGRQAKLVQQPMKPQFCRHHDAPIGRKTARACYKITGFGTGSNTSHFTVFKRLLFKKLKFLNNSNMNRERSFNFIRKRSGKKNG
jgi:hypothetical protein